MSDITQRPPLHWASHGITHRGTKREHNEDAIFLNDPLQAWLVADGMGGHRYGDLASQQVVSHLQQLSVTALNFSARITQLEEALIAANRYILDYATAELGGATMGSTLAALMIHGNLGFACWAGDSRVYRLRQGQLTCLTRDHSRLQDMLDRGVIRREDIANHPEANIITRALGVEAFLQLDMTLFSAQQGDTFLLCSDGLYNAANDEELIQQLSEPQTLDACQGLINTALTNSARDNVSAIVVRAQLRSY